MIRLSAGGFHELKVDLAFGLPGPAMTLVWVAVKELELSDYIMETLLFTIYTHYGNLI